MHIISEGESMSLLRILVAEDNPINQKIISLALKKHDTEVSFAANGREAVNQLQQTNFDVILMDMQMPVMDGYQAITYIRKEMHNAIPIIALTASTFEDEIQECLQVGANAHIAKPFDPATFYENIKNILNTDEDTDIVDFSYINELSSGKDSYIHDVLSIFMENTPQGLEKLYDMVVNHSDWDWDAISQQAHFLKSGLSIIKIRDAYETLQEIETLAKDQKERERIIHLLHKVKDNFNKAVPLIQARMK